VKNSVTCQAMEVILHGRSIAGPIVSSTPSVAKALAAQRALTVLSNEDTELALVRICQCKVSHDLGKQQHATQLSAKEDDSEMEVIEALTRFVVD
jgi:endoribonuclease Dicer